MKRVPYKKSLTGWFQCRSSCGWRKATMLFWLKAIDFVMANNCPRCGDQIAFRQTVTHYLANTGRG